MSTENVAPPKLAPFWKILLGNCIFAGIFVLPLCSFSLLSVVLPALVVMGVLLPMAVSASLKARGDPAASWRARLSQQRWARVIIYSTAVSIGVVISLQARQEEDRHFEAIVLAVDQYRAAENRYPDTLAELVPKYLKAVPRARFGRFMYASVPPDNASLSYMPEPYMHLSYDFKSKQLRTWD